MKFTDMKKHSKIYINRLPKEKSTMYIAKSHNKVTTNAKIIQFQKRKDLWQQRKKNIHPKEAIKESLKITKDMFYRGKIPQLEKTSWLTKNTKTNTFETEVWALFCRPAESNNVNIRVLTISDQWVSLLADFHLQKNQISREYQ